MNLKVVSFNILCGSKPDGNSIPERAPRLKTAVEQHSPDLIGFQENRPEWWPLLLEMFGEEYEIFNRYRAESELESSPLLWKKDRFEALKTGYFWLSETPEQESKGWDEIYDCYRMCVWVVLKEKASGKTFLFMNTHFGFGDKGQVASVKLIEQYKASIGDMPGFIVGDFNASPLSPAYSALTNIFCDVNAATAKDMQGTWHNFGKNDPQDISNHIDYCFIDNNCRPISYKTITDTFDGKFPSDHYGLVAEIEL